MSEYEVGEIPPEQLKKQAKRYGLEDFVKGRVDNETLDRIAHKADELQRMNLSEEDKAIAEKAAKLIARDYGETLRRLAEEDKEDAKYRKKIVK